MPEAFIEITVTEDPTYSDVQHKKGLMEFLNVDFGGGLGAGAIVSIEALVDGNEETGTWQQRWTSVAGNTDFKTVPVSGTTLQDGSAGNGEAHIPLRCPWRVKVAGVGSGTVVVNVSLDQG
jgi:hypothetical protein